jgi:hypothetical protein
VNPLQVHVSSQPTWRGTGAIMFAVWIMAAVFTITSVRSMYGCDIQAFLIFTGYFHHLLIFQLLVSCVLPLCVISFSYIMTAKHLVESSCYFSEETQNPQLNTRKNTAKVVLGLTLLFVISYVPYHVPEIYIWSRLKYEILVAKDSDEIDSFDIMFNTLQIARYFLSINSCLNPVSLFCTSHAFRTHFIRYVTCCCKTKSPPTDFELTRRY